MSQKKLLISSSILSLVLSSGAYAITDSTPFVNYPPSNIELFIPTLKPGVEVNIAALWLKAGASNLNYVIYNKELPAQSPGWTEQELRPSFAPAFELGVRYNFQQPKGTDINLDWTHLDSSTSSSIAAPNSSFFLGPDYVIGPDAIPIRNASGKVNFKYDVINLDAGQYVNIGQHVDMRFFGGLSTGFLREEVTAIYSGTTGAPFAGPFSMNQQVTSNFTGIGPRVGIQTDVDINENFSFIGEAAASALIGSVYSKTNYIGSAQELLDLFGQTLNYQTIMDKRVYQVIPGFDAKLGIDFHRTFKNGETFKVALGYQAAVYVNAISQYLPGSLVSGQSLTVGGIYVATMSHTLSNYSVQGPFLNFALEF